MVTEISMAHAGYPISRLASYCQQFDKLPEDFVDMISLHVVIDTSRGRVLSKYLKANIIGDPLLNPKEIAMYLKEHIGKSKRNLFHKLFSFIQEI